MAKSKIEDFYLRPDDEALKWEKITLRIVGAPRTRREVAQKLRDRGCPEERIEPLLDRFQELRMIDDRLYARLYMESKRDYGLRRLRDELRLRGVSDEDIEDALDECEVDEVERALTLLRRWSGLHGMTPQKLYGRLSRRGFSGSAVHEAFSLLCEELDEEDDGED